MAKRDHNGQPVADASTSKAVERGCDEASEGMPLNPKLPAFDVATELICIRPCVLYGSEAATLSLEVLRLLQTEIQDRFRVPVTLECLRECPCGGDYNANANAMSAPQSRSWSGRVEAISRCVAAWQKAIDAREYMEAQGIVVKLCSHKTVLTHKALIHIENTDLVSCVQREMDI